MMHFSEKDLGGTHQSFLPSSPLITKGAVYILRVVSVYFVCAVLKISADECRCNFEDMLIEMDRILRPEGAVIIRDEVDMLVKVKKIVTGMRWETRMVDHEDGPLVSEKILVAVKQYWTVDGGNNTSTQR